MRNSLKRAAALAFAVLMLLTLVPVSLAEEIVSATQTQTSEWVIPGISDGGALMDAVRNYSDAFERLMAEEDADAFSELAGQYKADEGFWTWISQSLEAGTLTEERVAALNEKIAAADNAGAFDELSITGSSTVPVGGTITLTSNSGSETDASLHTWSVGSNQQQYATVEGNGQTATVTGVQASSIVTITHEYKNSRYGSRHSETFQVTVVTSITGPDTVAVDGAITLTSVSGSLDDANLHTWSVGSNQQQYATVTGNGRTAVLNGLAEGTVTVTHTFRNSAGGTEYTDSFQVTVKKPKEEAAQVFYLKTPTSDPNSNQTSEWCDASIGNGTVETTGGTWVNDKNIFNPSAFVKGMPEGITAQPDGTYLMDRTTYADDYTAIFDAYKTQLESELGVTLKSVDDIKAIYLVPYKISKKNSSTPDKHIDCTIRVKLKNDLVFAAVFWVTMPDGTVEQADAKNYTKNSEVSITTKAPTGDDGAYPDEKVYNGITYVFDGWYNEAKQKVSDTAWPYTPSSPELADGTVNFYAKYVPKQTTVTVKKVVVGGTDVDMKTAFTFTYTDSDGKTQTFTLSHNTEMTIPVKVGQEDFTVTETEDALFSTAYKIGTADEAEGLSARIDKIEDGGNYTIVFTNTRRTGALTIAKQVTGNMGDKTKSFRFSYSYGTTNGEFTLADGETQELTGIPYGTEVTITEDDYGTGNGGYTTSCKVGKSGTVTAERTAIVTIDKEAETITFTNHKDGYPDTGVLLDSLPYALILAAVVIAAVIVIVRKRRHRDDD